MRRIERRDFTREASLAFLAGVVVVISDCGGGGGGGSTSDGYGNNPAAANPPPTSADGSKTGDISANHGHVAVITAAEVQAGGVLANMSIKGSAGHDHTISLPAQAMQDIKDGKKVSTDSTSTQGHQHTVTFNPDVSEPPTRY
jgi:hypothetical protein